MTRISAATPEAVVDAADAADPESVPTNASPAKDTQNDTNSEASKGMEDEEGGGVAADHAGNLHRFAALQTPVSELMPPFGVLRVQVNTQAELVQLETAVADAALFLSIDLISAAAKLEMETRGKLFQALVQQGVSEKR